MFGCELTRLALTVSVPEPSGFVVSNVMVKFLCRFFEVELGW